MNLIGGEALQNPDASPFTGTYVGTGTKYQTNLDGTLETRSIVIYGDVDGNGAISVEDLAKMKSVLLKSDTLSGAYLAAGAFGKANVSISDLLTVKKHLIGVSTIDQSAY